MLKWASFQKFWTRKARYSLSIFFFFFKSRQSSAKIVRHSFYNVNFELPLPPLSQCWSLWSVWGTLRQSSLYHPQHWPRAEGNEIQFYCSLNNFSRWLWEWSRYMCCYFNIWAWFVKMSQFKPSALISMDFVPNK